jgi:hypothetical protein
VAVYLPQRPRNLLTILTSHSAISNTTWFLTLCGSIRFSFDLSTTDIMSDQGLRISGMAADGNDSVAFDPLMFLANVAIQDAMHHVSLQDTVMQDVSVQGAVMQDAGTGDTDMQEATSLEAGTEDTNTQDAVTRDTSGQEPVKQEEAASGSNEAVAREVVTANQLLSMVASQSLMATDPPSSISMDPDEDDADNEASCNESDSDVKDKTDLKGKGKGKSRGSNKKSADERARETAARVESMAQQREEDEQQVLRDMRRDEAINMCAALNGAESSLLTEIEATGIQSEDAVLVAALLDQDSDEESEEEIVVVGAKRRLLRQGNDADAEVIARKNFSFFSDLSNYPELFMELARHLGINDLVSLYAISKDFNETLNGHLSHILKACAAYRAPESSRIFVFTLYGSLCIRDPVGRPDPKNPELARLVPSLRWLRMVLHREKCVRDILACMAREGHRMPKTMSLSIKKMWLTMDIPTSSRRVQLMHNEKYWTDNDLYNLQMLFIKLDMRFNDPIEGPADDGLRKLMLGQRGLTPLCRLLKRTRFTDSLEVLEACVRYSYWPRHDHRHLPILGVPANQIGRGHLEGWGVGQVHLYRPDELVMRESCRRNMDLKSHLYTMICWGYVESDTGKNIVVTKEEMYMSDDDDEAQLRRKKRMERVKALCGGRVPSIDKSKGEETNEDEKEKGEDKYGLTKEKSRDGEGDVRMAG